MLPSMPALPDWFAWALLVLAAFLALAWWRAHTRVGRNNRRRQVRALAGETEAEQLLEAHGYAIEERQITLPWELWIDGEPREVRSRADLLVSRDGLRFVAEVKTGSRAPDPTRPATRRQLLEYAMVFPVAGVLLVDVGAGCIHEVHWEDPARR